MKAGDTIEYSGPAQAFRIDKSGDVHWKTERVNIKGEFVVEEIHPYEPSAYVWESCIDVVPAYSSPDDDVIYSISEADYMDYLGLCPDCLQDHGPNPIDCPFQRMVD